MADISATLGAPGKVFHICSIFPVLDKNDAFTIFGIDIDIKQPSKPRVSWMMAPINSIIDAYSEGLGLRSTITRVLMGLSRF